MNSFRLRDGRLLTWREYGDPDGRPVLYCHGTPGSGVEIESVFGAHASAARAGVRLIAPDRPGMGGSTYQHRRSVASWVEDVDQLLVAIGLVRYSILGYSGGAAYACTLLANRSHQVDRVALLAPAAPFEPQLSEGLDRNGVRIKALARRSPLVTRGLLGLVMRRPALRHPERLLQRLELTLPDSDRDALSVPSVRAGFVVMMRTAFQSGVRGVQTDLALMSEWRVPAGTSSRNVRIWQGKADTTGATPAMAQALHESLPDSRVLLTQDGHLSLVQHVLDEVFGYVAQRDDDVEVAGVASTSIDSPKRPDLGPRKPEHARRFSSRRETLAAQSPMA